MSKRTKLLFGIALIVACLIVGGGVFFAKHDHGGVKAKLEQFKQDLKNQKAAGQLPPDYQGVDLDQLEFGMQVPADVQIRMDIARLLADMWYVLIPLVFVWCFGLAALLAWLCRTRAGGAS